jgi:hypothetical protein
VRVAIISRRDDERLQPIAGAFARAGADTQLIVYSDAIRDAVRESLRNFDAALVWVDPISGGEDRGALNALLRDVALTGGVVSAHPDTIDVMGTKDVLFRTRTLGWANDIARYANEDELRTGLKDRLSRGPRVVKRERGNAGVGVWRVEAIGGHRVRVHGAQVRDLSSEELAFDEFVARCAPYFAHGACVIDQPFEPRVAEGIVRCYMVVDEVVGFALQGPGELASNPRQIMGLPSPKTMFPPDSPRYSGLRHRMETEWLSQMCTVLGLTRHDLPLLWDADFLLGTDHDSFVLCEINASCVTPFPPETPERLAQATLARLRMDPDL